MTTLLTSELIDRCHSAARAKGFWDIVPPQGQQLMLVISELAEALEADRKGKKATALPPALVEHFTKYMGDAENGARALFENTIKDTPADELADAYIRLCDFVGGFELRFSSVKRFHEVGSITFDKYPASFAEALLGVTSIICDAATESKKEEYIGDALAAIEWVAKSEAIDLATHIDLKLRYNATRPAKHGKAY
jgi:hypothetical protein